MLLPAAQRRDLSLFTRPRQVLRALVCLLLLFGLVRPATVEARERILSGITSERLLMVDPEVLGPVDAQTAVRTRARFRTGELNADRERAGETPDISALLLIWDLSFGGGDNLEFGASLSGGYTKTVDPETERISLERGVAFGRFAARRGEEGPLIAATFAFGRQLRLPGNLFAELGAQFGWRHGWPLAWDVDVWLAAELPSGEKTILFGGVGAGPSWRPTDWFDLSLEVTGGLSNRPELSSVGSDVIAWDIGAALQASFTIAERHCISIGIERTLYGAAIPETISAHLGWRFEWTTDDGLLRLDNDDSSSPETEPRDEEIPDAPEQET